MNKFLLVGALIVALYSCKSDEKNDQNSTATLQSTLAPDTSSLSQPTTVSSTSLHDIWVLDSINNSPIIPDNFSYGTPYLEIDTTAKTVKGHTGCNSLSGSIKVNGDKMIFDSLVVLKSICNDKGFEKNFVKGLKSGHVTHKILNDKLFLNTSPTSVYVFRRIRR